MEVQKRYEEEQWLQIWLKEVVEAYFVKRAAQKARKVAETKAKKRAKKWKLVEEEEKQKQLKSLKQLWNEVLAENATFLESTEISQVTDSKCKKIISEDEKEQWLPKKTKEKQLKKYYGDIVVKMGCINLCERYVCAGQNCLVHKLKWVIEFVFFLY